MSYCVECGVKLAESEDICPLCNTVVINPNRTKGASEEERRPYPERIELQKNSVNRRNLAIIGLLFLLVPVGITAVFDLLGDFQLSWSLYVAGGSALTFVIALLPMVMKKPNCYLCLLFDTLATAGFLAVIAFVIKDFKWCIYLGIPIVVLTGCTACIIAAVVRGRRLKVLSKAGWILVAFSAFMLALELTINLYIKDGLSMSWSIYVATPLVLFSLLLFVINGKPAFVDELKRRLFV